MAVNLPDSNTEPSKISSIRTTKRKFDDAFHSLDDTFRFSDASPRPQPSKRPHILHSLHSALAKYGIKSKESQPSQRSNASPLFKSSKGTPHLTAILTRATTRNRKTLPFKFSGLSSTPAPPLPPTAEYSPSSIPAFLSRLATFKLSTYTQKSPAIDAVAAAKCGWVNEGKDRLVCGLCKGSWIIAGRDGMSKDAANTLIEKHRISLVEMHKDGCPWKARQCDPSIYRIPLQTPSAMVRDIRDNAITLDPLVKNIEVKHPLTAIQLCSFRSALSSFEFLGGDDEAAAAEVFTHSQPAQFTEPSDPAILTSLFGWSLVSAVPPDASRRTSFSRATSVAPSILYTPSASRPSSASSMAPAGTSQLPLPLRTPPRPPMTPSRLHSGAFRMPPNSSPKSDAVLLQCILCQRRVGLWAFTPQPLSERPPSPRDDDRYANSDSAMDSTPSASSAIPSTSAPAMKNRPCQRQFDLLKEHRSYCPYVVRSAIVPTLAAVHSTTPIHALSRSHSSISTLNGQNGINALEGWRAVLTMVVRYGMGRKRRLGLDLTNDDIPESMEVNEVKAMVEDVKSRGGKDLLRYIKGLLG